MKKFLQKTLAVLALCLVSVNAWAETETFNLSSIPGNNGNFGTPIIQNGISVSSTTWGAELYGDGSWAKLKVEGVEGDITQIVLNLSAYSSSDYCAIAANTGTFTAGSTWGPSVTWSNTANAKQVIFTSDYDTADFYVTSITVTYTPSAPSTTFSLSCQNIEENDVLSAFVTAGLTLSHAEKLAFADGKTAEDILVNGNPLSAETFVLFNLGQTWINCTIETEGVNTVTIPEGVFVNESGKTNEEFVLHFTIFMPGFAVSAAEWTTFCYGSDWVMPFDYVGYIVSDIVDGHAILTASFPGGYVVPGNFAVLINGPETAKAPITFSGFYGATPDNYLRGNSGENPANFTASSIWIYKDDEYCSTLYKFCDGENGLGFYYDSVDGATLTCQPNKAFLAVPASKANSNGLKIRFADEDVTGINAIATESNDAIYNLQGQRVNATAAGIYVKNGKKFIVK